MININKQKEEEFYAKKDFCFSYSSLNKLLFSPSLFYKDYILFDREVRTDKHLIEGKLIHCLLFEPKEVDNKFSLMPGKSPSDNIRKVLKDMALYTDAETLVICDDSVILDSLKNLNLFQSLKADESRIAKIRTEDNEPYWKFLGNSNVDVVDQDTLLRCEERVGILKQNKDVMALFSEVQTDFDLDPVETFSEKYLKSELIDCDFGLHGYIDYYSVNTDKREVTICDLKTTGKTISDFKETIDFYNYWLQAAIYMKLVYDTLGDDKEEYNLTFKFIVIDKYNQVYVFDVSDNTMHEWAGGFSGAVKTAKFHYNSRNYSLPVAFLENKVTL
jgi:hypothetical protein|tara:strand:- start:604 stop:1596 length:993 start_codon:yes stop_codon:yes gene_type:complete